MVYHMPVIWAISLYNFFRIEISPIPFFILILRDCVIFSSNIAIIVAVIIRIMIHNVTSYTNKHQY